MKLTRKHIGGLYVVKNSDGSWVYQLVDVRKGELLFYSFGGRYEIEKYGKHKDWVVFHPTKPWPKTWLKYGWQSGRRDECI